MATFELSVPHRVDDGNCVQRRTLPRWWIHKVHITQLWIRDVEGLDIVETAKTREAVEIIMAAC